MPSLSWQVASMLRRITGAPFRACEWLSRRFERAAGRESRRGGLRPEESKEGDTTQRLVLIAFCIIYK